MGRSPVYIDPSTPVNTVSAVFLCSVGIFSISCKFSSAKDERAVPFFCTIGEAVVTQRCAFASHKHKTHESVLDELYGVAEHVLSGIVAFPRCGFVAQPRDPRGDMSHWKLKIESVMRVKWSLRGSQSGTSLTRTVPGRNALPSSAIFRATASRWSS